MAKKGMKIGLALAAGAGAAAVLAKTTSKEHKAPAPVSNSDYRNTERGKYEKNSKGIYYSNGNYEAFARPEKPEGVDHKNAYIVGSGLASLAAACFLVRDGQIPALIFIFLRQWILPEEPATASLIPAAAIS